MSVRMLLELAHLHYLEALEHPMGSRERNRLLGIAADINMRARKKR